MTLHRVLEPDDWGMVWVRPPVSERLADPELFIHHRAGNPQHRTDAAAVFRQMQAADVARGYSTVGYDLLVHENTVSDTVTIGVARGPWRSAATADRNEQGEAVCAVGYFHPGHKLSARPSAPMIEGVARACVLSIDRGWSARDAVQLGHRDNPAHPAATACPGDYLYVELPTIRRRVAELLANPPSPQEEEDMELFTLTPGPAPLFQRTGGLVRWVSLAEWQAMGSPPAERVMGGAEAARYRFIVGALDDPTALSDARVFGSRG